MVDQITLYADGAALYCASSDEDRPRRIDLRVEPDDAGEHCPDCDMLNPADYVRCMACGAPASGAE